jgi:hypothetical protein
MMAFVNRVIVVAVCLLVPVKTAADKLAEPVLAELRLELPKGDEDSARLFLYNSTYENNATYIAVVAGTLLFVTLNFMFAILFIEDFSARRRGNESENRGKNWKRNDYWWYDEIAPSSSIATFNRFSSCQNRPSTHDLPGSSDEWMNGSKSTLPACQPASLNALHCNHANDHILQLCRSASVKLHLWLNNKAAVSTA